MSTMQENVCKGLFYRGVVNTFINNKGHIIEKTSLIPLKKLSCVGCSCCKDIRDFINEDINCNTFPSLINIEHGKIYKVFLCGDWDGCEIGIKEIEGIYE